MRFCHGNPFVRYDKVKRPMQEDVENPMAKRRQQARLWSRRGELRDSSRIPCTAMDPRSGKFFGAFNTPETVNKIRSPERNA